MKSALSLLPTRRNWRRAFAVAWRRTHPETAAVDTAALDAVRGDLEAHMAAWAESPEGRTLARTELMDSIDRQLLHRALLRLDSANRAAVRERVPELSGAEPDLQRYLAAGELRIRLLREWSGLYYGDRARGDWFEAYRRAADMRLESVRRDLERLAGAPVHAAEHHRDAAIRGLNTALRLRLLKAPGGVAIGHRNLRSRLRSLLRRSYDDRLSESDAHND